MKREINEWKQDLGTEIKLRIKAEQKLSQISIQSRISTPLVSNPFSVSTASNESQSSETVCYICAEPILNYIPTVFLGNEVNPACKNCKISFCEDDKNEQLEEHSVANDMVQQEGRDSQTPFLSITATNLTSKANSCILLTQN